MKKLFLILLTVSVLSACSESSSDSTSTIPPNPPPIYKDSLTFIENAVPMRAVIHADDTLLTDRPTAFKFLIENFTRNPYNNISFSIDPVNDSLYSIGTSKIISDEDCTSLEYATGCIITVNISAKTEGDINFTIKMTSDRGENVFPITPIQTAYILQPSHTVLNFSNEEKTKTFIVANMRPSGATVFPNNLLNYTASVSSSIPMPIDYQLENDNGDFTLSRVNEKKEFTLTDGTKLRMDNCLAADIVVNNNDKRMCYVDITFANAAVGSYSNTLTIKDPRILTKTYYKYAKITLSATNN